MLERYFTMPKTVDRIRRSWLAEPIERYVVWLTERHFAPTSITRRVSLVVRFGEFARRRGATRVVRAAALVDAFVTHTLRQRLAACRSPRARRVYVAEVKRPITQMLHVVLPGREVSIAAPPLAEWAPGFFTHLREERGLQPDTISLYRYYLKRFEQYASRRAIKQPDSLTPAHLDGFIEALRPRTCPAALHAVVAALRAVLRFMFRQGRMHRDLSGVVDAPRTYRLSEIPRSIAWDDVRRTLESVDRRSDLGRRDYAMLVLLAVYGLRAREVAGLTLNDIDWRGATLHVRGRKAGHSTAYPLSARVGEAVLNYIQHGRPATADRRVFMIARAPRRPVTGKVVADRANHYLNTAGVVAPRLGSHTLRHSVAQRLVDADFSLKVIGDYLGHRCPSSTRIYSKVAVESLRELALGDGEQIL